jgi:parvulin-like peptidyl-prolyl isomerase
MATVMQLGNRALNADDLIPLLSEYHLLPHLLRESIVDQAIAPFTCTPEETETACQRFFQQHQLDTAAQQQAWIERYGMTQTHLESAVTRQLRIEKFKQATWGHKLGSFFLNRKGQLDRAIYRLIRTDNPGIAHELFFRLEAGEQTFTELAQTYSKGPEANTGGLVGPVELGSLHPALSQLLQASQPGRVNIPVRLGEWTTIVRLERLIPAQLDDAMRQRLLNEAYEGWLRDQIEQLPEADRIWLGATQTRSTAPAATAA